MQNLFEFAVVAVTAAIGLVLLLFLTSNSVTAIQGRRKIPCSYSDNTVANIFFKTMFNFR